MSLGQVSALDHRSESASIRARFGPRTGQVNAGQCMHMERSRGIGLMLSSHQAGWMGKVINFDVKYHMTRDFLVPNWYGLIDCKATRVVFISVANPAAQKVLPVVRSRSRVLSTV